MLRCRYFVPILCDGDVDYHNGAGGADEVYSGHPHPWVSHGPAGQGPGLGGRGGGGNYSLKRSRVGTFLIKV